MLKVFSPPKRKKWDQKRAKLGSTSDNWMEISKIENIRDRQRFLPRLPKKNPVNFGRCTNNKVGHVSLDTPKSTYLDFGRPYFGP